MLKVGFIYLALVATACLVSRRVSAEKTRQCLTVARASLLRVVPLLLAIFGLVGLFQVFCPPQLIEQWLGATSGGLSLLVGGLAGALAIGPPLAAFPLAASLLDAGAWPPAIAAFIVSWISVGVITLPFEASVFGWRFALSRNGLSLAAALLIGLGIGVLL